MKIACTSSAFARALHSGQLTQLEFLDLASNELRADGVVLDVRHFPRTDDDYLAQIKKIAADTGLVIAAISCNEFFTSNAEAMAAHLHIASATGAPLLAGRLAHETALPWSAQLERLSEATSQAKAANITLAVRNAPGTFAGTAADCKRVSKEADSAWLRFGLEPRAFDLASDPSLLADRTVLLWSSSFEAPLRGAPQDDRAGIWDAYNGFVALDHPAGEANPAEMRSAIRTWRTATS